MVPVLVFGCEVKKKHISNKKKWCVNYMKMKNARPLIFSVCTYDSNMSMHTKNQFPGFIQFFWLYDQNNVFQTKKLICVNYRKMKKARLMISNMNTCHIYVSIHAKYQPPSFIHFLGGVLIKRHYTKKNMALLLSAINPQAKRVESRVYIYICI